MSQRSRDAVIYYGMQLGILGVPILLIPFYGHVLGAAGFGLVSQGQAFATIIAIIVDYGFQLTAVRNVVASRDDPQALGRIFADVLAAKFFLAFLVVLGSIAVFFLVPVFRTEPLLYIASLAFGIVQGLSLYWYFCGRLHYITAGCLELGGRLLAAALIFAIVRDASHAWLVQALFALSMGAFFILGLGIAYRHVPFTPFSIKGARAMLSTGTHIFTLAVVGAIYSNANVLLLGFVASPVIVGIFSGAEKIAKLSITPFAPIRQIFFPMVTAKRADDPRSAWLLIRRLMLVSMSFCAIVAIVIFVFAEPIVEIVLGPTFLPSIPVLRVMAVTPILLVVTECLGTLWLLPNRMDKVMTCIMAISGAFHVLLFMVLSKSFGAVGSGVAVVASQFLIFVLVYWAARSVPKCA